MSEIAELASEIEDAVAALPSRDTASIRALRRQYTKRLRGLDARLVVDLALTLWRPDNMLRRDGRVHRFFGDELIANHQGARESLRAADVLALGHGISSWDQVDCFGLYISGPSWRRGQIDDGLIHAWAASGDRWWRRAALVSTIALNARAQGGTGDTPRTLALCDKLIADRDDMVVKSMSWALRILSARDPEAVRRYIEINREVLAPRVLREVGHKLTTGLKNPRRSG